MPYLTAERPGVGGRIKARDADFRVVELPLYIPIGHGEHVYARIEKTGLSTFEAVRRIARALRIDPRAIGYAGLKDAHAIAEQTLSLGNVPLAPVERLDLPGIRVLSVDRHTNKLRMGHLRGNRFTIRISDTNLDRDQAGAADVQSALPAARDILDVLARYGAPNYFGEQRFGLRGDTDRLGRALVRQEDEAFVRTLVGLSRGKAEPSHGEAEPTQEERGAQAPAESPSVRQARALFEAGDLEASLLLWPAHMEAERRAIQTLIDRPGEYARAVRAIPGKMRSFYVSAYQSALFNRVLARRLASGALGCAGHEPVSPGRGSGIPMPRSSLASGALGCAGHEPVSPGRGSGIPMPRSRAQQARWQALGTLVYGDLAYIHAKGAVFLVEDPAAEQARADRLEISPSGPLYGFKLTQAQGVPGEMEQQVLAEEGLELEDFRLRGLKLQGARRPLRFPLSDAAVEEEGRDLIVSFTLPPGCYATVVLREIMKDE